jgi:HK97 family phage major capsid protein
VFAQSVALSSGLQRLQTEATTVWIPSVAGGSAGWYTDLDAIGDAGISADEAEVRPKKVAATQIVSNESAGDANAAELVGRALTNALVQQVDEAFFAGSGTVKGPDGLPGVTGASTVDADPAASLDAFVDAIAEVEQAGGVASAIYLQPSTWATLSKIKTEVASTQPVLSPQGGLSLEVTRSLYGLPVYTSRFVEDDVAWVVDARRLIVVERTNATVDVEKSVRFFEDATVLRATMRLEFVAPIPGIVCRIENTP